MIPDRQAEPSSSVVVLCAMRAEAAPIIEALGLRRADVPWKDCLPMALWRHPIDDLSLVTNGVDTRTGADLIGTTPAALATAAICTHLAPAAILSAGAAGGRSGKTSIGQAHLIDRAYHHDRRIPLPEFAEYAIGPERLHAPSHLAAACSATIATISTGNSLDTLAPELLFFDEHAVTVKDMETSAIAWVCAQHGVPCVGLRAITDYFDHASPADQFLANFDLAIQNLTAAVARAIPVLLGG